MYTNRLLSSMLSTGWEKSSQILNRPPSCWNTMLTLIFKNCFKCNLLTFLKTIGEVADKNFRFNPKFCSIIVENWRNFKDEKQRNWSKHVGNTSINDILLFIMFALTWSIIEQRRSCERQVVSALLSSSCTLERTLVLFSSNKTPPAEAVYTYSCKSATSVHAAEGKCTLSCLKWTLIQTMIPYFIKYLGWGKNNN